MPNQEKYTLKELRTKKGLKQTEVAKAIGVNVSTYINYEKDLSNVGVKRVLKIADYFKVSVYKIKL